MTDLEINYITRSSLYICTVGRIIAIDYGLKRCGLAVTDSLKLIASPLETVENKQLLYYLEQYLEQEEVEAIVVGMPYNLDGSVSDMCNEVERLKTKLKERFPNLPIHEVDERMTSIEAQRIVVQSVKSKKKRREKGLLDRVSASIILEAYLNKNYSL